jgi:hypothetical protein
MIVKGTTKSGIKYQLDSRIKDDARLLFLCSRAQNADDPALAGKAAMDMLSLIFGSEDNVLEFMNEVARVHKGVCQVKDLWSEMQQMLESLNAKNS